MKASIDKAYWQECIKGAHRDSIPVICIMGATATGKTDVAALMTEHIPAELISVDSSLVYRGMNVGTAKPNSEFLKKYPHHLVDVRNPDETYSAADFCKDAESLISDVISRGNIPILVGGTSFYFAAIEKGLPNLPEKNPMVRQQIENEAEKMGWQHMHEKLRELDQKSAERIHQNDPQRIQRALEIIQLTGKPVVAKSLSKPLINNPIIKIAVYHNDRKVLHKRIEKRFNIMMEQGLAAEIDSLLNEFPREVPAFRMIGYRQYIDGIHNDETLDSIIEKSIIATRQLAKRQLTWLRNQSGLLWQDVNQQNLNQSGEFLAQYSQYWLQNYIRRF